MRPTAFLMEEHRVIEQVLACLERVADNCDAGQPLDLAIANQIIDFIREYADHCHHAKEEQLLFPLMERKGFSRDHGPTGVMLFEHDQGRGHVRAMAESVSQLSAGHAAAKDNFILQARVFVQLLRQHIDKEDHCLFPMADQALSSADQNELEHSFDRVEHDQFGPAVHKKYRSLAMQLAERLNVAVSPSLARADCGSCSHEPTNKSLSQ